MLIILIIGYYPRIIVRTRCSREKLVLETSPALVIGSTQVLGRCAEHALAYAAAGELVTKGSPGDELESCPGDEA